MHQQRFSSPSQLRMLPRQQICFLRHEVIPKSRQVRASDTRDGILHAPLRRLPKSTLPDRRLRLPVVRFPLQLVCTGQTKPGVHGPLGRARASGKSAAVTYRSHSTNALPEGPEVSPVCRAANEHANEWHATLPEPLPRHQRHDTPASVDFVALRPLQQPHRLRRHVACQGSASRCRSVSVKV